MNRKWIRRPQCFVSLLFSLLFVLSQIQCIEKPLLKEELPGPKKLDLINLFDSTESEDVSCYRIPSILTASNGDLIVAADQRVPSCGDLRSNNDINIVIRRSKDNGDSWSDIQAIIDYDVGESASDPSMILDRMTNEIFLFYNYMDLHKAKGKYKLKLIKSKDNGLSWSDPIDITSQITNANWENDFKFITSGFLIETPIQPGDESKIIELPSGEWMINSRVNTAGFRYEHRSNDQGKSWTSKPDSSLIDPSCNASLINYTLTQNGRERNLLLFSNANNADSRRNLTIKISEDEGENWSDSKTIYSGKSAYSSMTILDNGDIGILFEKDDYKFIDFVSFPALRGLGAR